MVVGVISSRDNKQSSNSNALGKGMNLSLPMFFSLDIPTILVLLQELQYMTKCENEIKIDEKIN